MKLMGWAIALAAAGLTPAVAAAPQVNATPVRGPARRPSVGTQAAEGARDRRRCRRRDHRAPGRSAHVAPTPGIGMPPTAASASRTRSPTIGQRAAGFHNGPLLLMCAVISVFVLLLLAFTMFRFRRGANPKPSRTSHNTLLEVIWTVVPVLVLVAIAIPSIRLLAHNISRRRPTSPSR